METRTQEQQQKDFLASFFPSELPVQRGTDLQQQSLINSGNSINQQHMLNNFSGLGNSQLNMDLMNNMMVMQSMEMSPSSAIPQYTPQALLEQQYKLNQLQQLQQLQNQIQNQIFQQQLALIKGQSIVGSSDSPSEHTRDQVSNFHGLPTPVSSTELRPMPNPEYMSPMNQPYMDSRQDMYQSGAMDTIPLPSPHAPPMTNQYSRHPGSSSAPANIAFQNPFPLPSPSELDIDVSPLTSPWLGAYNQQSVQPKQPNKRTASPSGDEGVAKPSRKRMSPATANTSNSFNNSKRATRVTKSASSTPLLRSTRSRRDSVVMGEDSPSPVDLSMPPPAPPAIPSSASTSNLAVAGADSATSITPVTPASLMELGRLGISSSLTPVPKDAKLLKSDPKGKSTSKSKPSTEAGSSRTLRKNHMLISPGPKPILPAGSTNIHAGSSAAHAPPVPQSRKSHKDAEQKRRDSLKTTFDDLRILLPPIPLPSDENFPDVPILPGALPPRGPPKAGGEGPNKGVSKLQLLRCGNDYIRLLKGRIDRRDDEIGKLRHEVLRLRGLVNNDLAKAGEEPLDLERDLDDVELSTSLGGGSVVGDDEPDDCDD